MKQTNLRSIDRGFKAKKFGAFELRKDGVYCNQKTRYGTTERKVCSPLEVVAQSRDENGQEWGYVLEWNDPDGVPHQWSVPKSLAVRTGTELAEALAKGGLGIAPKSHALLKDYIFTSTPSAIVVNVRRPGWFVTKEGRRCFVQAHGVIGDVEQGSVVLQADSYDPSAQKTNGDLLGWKANVASKCVGNDLMTFGVCVAFAAPMLELLGKDSGGFHLQGTSSSGKSTTLHVAASVWGDPVQTWRATDNALEDTAERHNDVLLPLDELSQLDPKKAAEVAYMLGNGDGKQRMNQSILPQPKKKWRLLFLSTGELTLADHVETAGKKTKAGTEVRMVNIDADANVGMGAFGSIHGASGPAEFADSLKKLVRDYSGSAGPAFVKAVIENEHDVRKRMRTVIEEFIETHVPKGASGEIYRVADRFALVGAAGEMATECGITGWAPGEAVDAAGRLFDSWLGKRSTGSSDMDKAVDQVREIIFANPTRFDSLGKEEGGFPEANNSRPVYNRLGFKRTLRNAEDGECEYFMTPEAFKKELCKGYDAAKVAQELDRRGHLRRDTKGRLQVQLRAPGMGRTRFYAIQPSIFQDAEDKHADTVENGGTLEPVAESGSPDDAPMGTGM